VTKKVFFAGGGTGGHIYPALAVAEEIVKAEPSTEVHFFVSNRDIDAQILGKTGFSYTALSARGFSLRPTRFIEFCKRFLDSYGKAKEKIASSENAVVVGVGGFVAGPVCYAAHKLGVHLKLLNVDAKPGRANRLIGRWADEVFVQFKDTAKYFAGHKASVNVVGCPLRGGFAMPDVEKVKAELGLDADKKLLVVTGASSGAVSVNNTVSSLTGELDGYADEWQMVHLSGVSNVDDVQRKYVEAKMKVKVLGYYDDMASLLTAADLVIGRSGAVSVAEFAAAGVASILMPYPHHKDMHQYLNAAKLVDVGAAVVVDDLPDENDRREWLWEELEELLRDDKLREEMGQACATIGQRDAAAKIAEKILRSV